MQLAFLTASESYLILMSRNKLEARSLLSLGLFYYDFLYSFFLLFIITCLFSPQSYIFEVLFSSVLHGEPPNCMQSHHAVVAVFMHSTVFLLINFD